MRKFILIVLIIPLMCSAQTPMSLLLAKKASSCPSDVDAAAFLTAASISDPTICGAINQLVLDLKSNSLWTKMFAIYPLVGNSLTSCKWNLKDPRDLDAAFRLTFTGTPTASSTGVAWNGTTQFADTHFIPSSSGFTTTNGSFSYYSRTNNAAAAAEEMGSFNGTTGEQTLLCRFSGNLFYAIYGNSFPNVSSSNSSGLFEVNMNGANIEGYYNGTGVISSAVTGILSTFSIYLGARNVSGTADRFSNRECAIATISSTLTSGQSSTFNTIITTFRTALSR